MAADADHGGTVNGGPPQDDAALGTDDAKRLSEARERIRQQLGKIIVGQDDVIEEILIGLFSRGHVLLEGVPGLAKTLMISTLAQTLDLSFSRIQFTPDLMPADVTGTEIIEEDRNSGHRELRFMKGPLFANVVLADEINRTPPKTQASLLEAMQERQVTVGRTRHPLDNPFFVLATQNPIEQEGTYPLPEAQQDRFMFKIFVEYPTFDEEFEVARRTTGMNDQNVQPVMAAEEIIRLQDLVRRVPVSDHVIRYALSLVRQTRVGSDGVPEFVDELVGWGAGPRAVQFLILGGKARALLQGRFHVQIEDIQALAKPVLRHRMVVNFAAESEGIGSDEVIDRIIDATPTTEDALSRDARFQKIFAS
ncbi:AAA family ATPase [Crateriforma conspicua]|uniref:ATPase RavA n=1 Tax=Crateriforma conspicua TaxID=2527996 RepID=A0A5C6FXP9_9PLAN|nr:MoxR family ATPase [Crateriforma conspicua]TWU67166.1 ATPase RavA [Crateriforma conspicua]